MKNFIKKDLYLLLFVLLPFIYLYSIYGSLPQDVPVHWDINGQVDSVKDKVYLILLPILLPLLTYLILTVMPKVDPKKELDTSTKKHRQLKGTLTTLMSGVSLFILYTIKNESDIDLNSVILLVGAMYVVMGNFMNTIRPSYFLGIRTPWTLENEEVWKVTHQFGGKIWFIGGSLLVCTSLLFNQSITVWVFMLITGIVSITPVVYSYLEFKKRKAV